MKRLLLPALALLFLLTPPMPASAEVSVLVEYLDVPPEAGEQFETAMAGPVRTVNVKRLAEGKIFAWYHYRSRFPFGSGSDYTDTVVTVFTDFSSLESPNLSEGYGQWVHRSEVFQGVPGIRSADYYGKVAYTHVTVDFLTRKPASSETFLDHMKQSVMPRLQKRADDGEVVNWALFARVLPRGTAYGYEYALVSRYNGFATVETPQLDSAEHEHLTHSVVWKLMDIIE